MQLKGRICLQNSERGREEHDCTQFAFLIPCHDSTGCAKWVNICHRSRHNDMHCEVDLNKDCDLGTRGYRLIGKHVKNSIFSEISSLTSKTISLLIHYAM